MKIDFRDLRNKTEPMTRRERVTLQGVGEAHQQVETLSAVDVAVDASLGDHVCTVQGDLSFTVTYHCSRCLESCEKEQKAQFDEVFTDVLNQVGDEVHFATNGVAELDPYIEQSIHLAFEFFPVCSSTCMGLCSVCGVNRNEQTCTCDTKPIDPRLAELSDLLSQDESE